MSTTVMKQVRFEAIFLVYFSDSNEVQRLERFPGQTIDRRENFAFELLLQSLGKRRFHLSNWNEVGGRRQDEDLSSQGCYYPGDHRKKTLRSVR